MEKVHRDLACELQRLIDNRSIETYFQPIFASSRAHIHGHEALSRGPIDSPLQSPLDLLATAQATGRAVEVDLLMIELSIQRFFGSGVPGQLFVNVLPQTLLSCDDLAEWLAVMLARSNVRPANVVIEVTEHGHADDAQLICGRVQPLRRLGCEIAIDDLGAGSSGLKIWSELRPDYVKIDRYFTAQIEQDVVVAEILRSMLDMAHVMGSHVVAEGIENPRQCALLQDLGIDYLQGYYLQRPQLQPLTVVPQNADFAKVEPTNAATCAEQLLIERHALSPDTRIEDVVALFQKHADWDSLAVAAQGKPIGLVRRDSLLTLLSKPLYPEVYNRKPITKAMDAAPLVVDARARLDQVSRLVTGVANGRVNEDFIIGRHGEYIGLGRTMELLRQITAQQVRDAKQSNPLTLLPGNRQIEDQLFRLMALRTPFVLCHGDLDHFKSFNDEYGYRQGDQVLLHVADLFRQAATQGAEFVGHLGGDDFILMLRTGDWRKRLNRLFDSFTASIPNFYSTEHRNRGAISGVDREGRARNFPLMTLSIGAVEVTPERYADQDAVMQALNRAKARAKAQLGHALVLESEPAETVLFAGRLATMVACSVP